MRSKLIEHSQISLFTTAVTELIATGKDTLFFLNYFSTATTFGHPHYSVSGTAPHTDTGTFQAEPFNNVV